MHDASMSVFVPSMSMYDTSVDEMSKSIARNDTFVDGMSKSIARNDTSVDGLSKSIARNDISVWRNVRTCLLLEMTPAQLMDCSYRYVLLEWKGVLYFMEINVFI